MRTASTSLRRLPKALAQCQRCHSTLPSSSAASSSSPASPTPRLRFAPSPTGYLHLGGLRTALFNHLLARKWKGKWILRIEDTDRARLVEGSVDALRDTLEWAGLDYDEGVGAGGSHGPYTQSERLDLYQDYAKQLLSNGKAYECFCTATDLHAIRSSLLKQGSRQGYDGRCRHLTEEDVGRRKRAGHPYVIRFKSEAPSASNAAPVAGSSSSTGRVHDDLPADLIFGDAQPTMLSTIGDDFVIIKSDGWPTYHLASVVDDHLMEITHVLRGEEWLPSVPKHHQLYKAFQWTPPQFGHLPLLVNADGTKLSKRTGDVRVQHYRDQGYEPDALLNFLALMGWDHHTALSALPSSSSVQQLEIRKDQNSLTELFTPDQLIELFSIETINHRKAAVNLSKLEFLNKMTLRRKAGRLGGDGNMVDSIQEIGEHGENGVASGGSVVGEERTELLAQFRDYLKEEKALTGCELVDDLEYVEKVFDAELPRTVRLIDMATSSIFFFLDPDYSNLEAETLLQPLNHITYVEAVQAVATDISNRLESAPLSEDLVWNSINAVVSHLKFRNKASLTTPMRHALTGRKAGPSLPTIITVFGAERALARLRAGARYVKDRSRT